jgi:polyhydroxyalkanoate synthesis repressor PhaR
MRRNIFEDQTLAEEPVDKERLIKKYPNRRLYDTKDSRYITLDDARQMVVEGEDFKVVDQKTGEDLTRSILLQIIMEQENQGEPLFNSSILSEFIRNNSTASRDYFSNFLEASMKMFGEQQTNLASQMGEALKTTTPMDFWMDMTRKNLENLQQMQEQFFKNSQAGDQKK